MPREFSQTTYNLTLKHSRIFYEVSPSKNMLQKTILNLNTKEVNKNQRFKQ